MKKLFLLVVPFLFMSCATISKECMGKRTIANEKYFKKIDGINNAQEGNSKPYLIITFKAMKEINGRYDALVEYTNCLEGK